MSKIKNRSPSERNRDPILQVLKRVLPTSGTVLEIASGYGDHVIYFAERLPNLIWQPSDPDVVSRDSVLARLAASKLNNLLPPLDLNVLAPWPHLQVDAVINANMIHIATEQTIPAMCAGAAQVLRSGGIFHIYGPFKHGGTHTSQGNIDFDTSLRNRNKQWGIRNMEVMINHAENADFGLQEVISMPANNFSLVFVLEDD